MPRRNPSEGFTRGPKNGVPGCGAERIEESRAVVHPHGLPVALGDRDPTTYGLLAYSLEQEGNLIAAEVAYMQAFEQHQA